MKRALGVFFLAGVVALVGCLPGKKKEEDKGGKTASGSKSGGGGAAAGGGMDLTKYVQAPGRVMIGKEAKVGHMVKVKMVSAGTTQEHWMAVVAEKGGNWHVESTQGIAAYKSMSKDADKMIIGMVVAKKGGKVNSAVLGKKGEKGKKIKVGPPGPEPKQGEQAKGKDVTVKTAAGSFKAKMYEMSGVKTWSGVSGDTKGVLLKMEAKQGSKELSKKPAMATVDLGAKVKVKKLVYDDGSEMWMSENAAVKALQYGMVKSKTKHATVEVTKVGTKAKAMLKW